jgi:hypothetical protein
MKGVLTVLGWFWACRASTRDFCSALAVLVSPVQNIFFLTVHYFNSLVPIAHQAGQTAVLDRLSLSMCLWMRSSRMVRASGCQCQSSNCLGFNDSIPASSETVKTEGRQIKQYITVLTKSGWVSRCDV